MNTGRFVLGGDAVRDWKMGLRKMQSIFLICKSLDEKSLKKKVSLCYVGEADTLLVEFEG